MQNVGKSHRAKYKVMLIVVAVLLLLTACGSSNNYEIEDTLLTQNDTNQTTEQGSSVRPTQPNVSYNVGDIIQLGAFNWIVLDIQDNNALIITEEFIDRVSHQWGFGIWSGSSLFVELNDVFYSSFGDEDRARIIETMIYTDMYPYFETDTIDKAPSRIFLLSIEEVKQYFPNAETRILTWLNGNPTGWWLRSPGVDFGRAAYVGTDGEIVTRTDINGLFLLRPAMWISLN